MKNIDIKKLSYQKFYKKSSNKNSVFNSQPRSKWPDDWKRIYFKGYPRFERIPLDFDAWNDNKASLINTILSRRSSTKSSKKKYVSADDLSFLLSGGAITEVKDNDIYYKSYRAHPSAGARYPLEIYPLVFSSSNLKQGAYHYHVRTHSLEYMWPIEAKQLTGLTMKQTFTQKSKVFFLITAIIEKTTVKYGDRGFRYALMEAGHLAQNISLLAIAKGFYVCTIGNLYEKGFIKMLDLNENEELILYGISIL